MIEKLLIKDAKTQDRDVVSQCCVCKEFATTDISDKYYKFKDEQVDFIYTKYLVLHGYCPSCYKDALN